MNRPRISSTRFPRLTACGVHLGISAVVAAVVAVATLALWYPGVYKVLSGGRELFWLVVSVDVIMGPLLTLVVFDATKPKKLLARDLSIIAILQLAALAYGLRTVYLARPVAMVFEVDRFRVVSAADVREEELPHAKAAYQHLSLTGPWILGTRAASPAEKLLAIELAFKGYDLSQRPSFWQPYEATRAAALSRSRPIGVLLKQYPKASADIEARLRAAGVDPERARFVPLQGRTAAWIALLGPDAEIVGFAPYDGFF
ncbi:MAG: TfpX/TfpZ family type IV pilin accessory protein [Rhizobacter sp.]